MSYSFHQTIKDRVWAALISSSKKERTGAEIAEWLDEDRNKVTSRLSQFYKDGKVERMRVERSAAWAYKAF